MKYVTLIISCFLAFNVNAQQENALHFDGLDDEVIVNNASALIANSTQLSMSCWVYPENLVTTFPDYDGFCGFRNDVDADFYLVQIPPGNKVEARFRNSSGIAVDIIDSSLQLNTWQHYILTYDGAELTLYRNGVVAGTASASGMISNTTLPFNIGNLVFSFNNYFLKGRLDEVALWNRAIPGPEIPCIYENYATESPLGMQLYFRFNQGVAGAANFLEDTLVENSGSIPGILQNFALNGATSNWVSGIDHYYPEMGTICSGQTYTFGSQMLTQPGTYYESYTSAMGCDSVIRLLLSPVVNTTVSYLGNLLHALENGATYQWLDCTNGNIPIPNETNQDLLPTVDGLYAAIITNNGCTDTSDCIYWSVTGIKNFDGYYTGIIFPNPAHDKVYFTDISGNFSFEIFDIMGNLVQSAFVTEERSMDISHLQNGMYLIIRDSGNSLSRTLLRKY